MISQAGFVDDDAVHVKNLRDAASRLIAADEIEQTTETEMDHYG